MNKKFIMSVAVVLGCITSGYGMNNSQENSLNQMRNVFMSDVSDNDISPNQSIENTLYFITPASAANQDLLQSLISQAPPTENAPSGTSNSSEKKTESKKSKKKTIQLKVTSADFPLLNDNGLRILENEINTAYGNLSTWQQERLRFYAESGQFDAYARLIKFWHFVESVTYPLAGFCQLINSVLPLVSIGVDGSTFSLAMKIAICASGVFGLFFSQISQYAGTRISEETAIHDILQVLRRRQNLEALSNTSANTKQEGNLLRYSSDEETPYHQSENSQKKEKNTVKRKRRTEKEESSTSSFSLKKGD